MHFKSADANLISNEPRMPAHLSTVALLKPVIPFWWFFFSCLVLILQLSVVCMWALTPTWVSTHTLPWRPMNCWGSWAWNWIEQKRRWCLLWCHKLEVHAENACMIHVAVNRGFRLSSWHYLLCTEGFPCLFASLPCSHNFYLFLFHICPWRAAIAATQRLCVLWVPDPTGKTCGLSQGCHWDLGMYCK